MEQSKGRVVTVMMVMMMALVGGSTAMLGLRGVFTSIPLKGYMD
jgi:hypothetical protein